MDCKSFIAEPHTEILGGPSIFIEEGATMNLTCVVKESPEPPQYIFWYRDEQVWRESNAFCPCLVSAILHFIVKPWPQTLFPNLVQSSSKPKLVPRHGACEM